METLLTIWEQINSQLDWLLIIIVISVGEITKRLWKTKAVASFWKVLIVTLPVVVLIAWYSHIEFKIAFVSYTFAYWLYPFIVKWILRMFGGNYAKDPYGDNPNPDHEEH